MQNPGLTEEGAAMNRNRIVTDDFSCPASRKLYEDGWPNEPELAHQKTEHGRQCGACSFFAPFDSDWGLCCHPASRHHLETTFEHFTCPAFVEEGWGVHSFSTDKGDHCKCRGELREEYERLVKLLETTQRDETSPA
jgi:hypothetical protein